MKPKFCIVGATSGTGLSIARQLLQTGSSLRVLARYPDKARRLLGSRADILQGDVTDARSLRVALAADDKAIFFTVAATGGMDGRGLFASETMIRNVTYQGLRERGRFGAGDRLPRADHSPFGFWRRPVIDHDSHS